RTTLPPRCPKRQPSFVDKVASEDDALPQRAENVWRNESDVHDFPFTAIVEERLLACRQSGYFVERFHLLPQIVEVRGCHREVFDVARRKVSGDKGEKTAIVVG